MTKFKSYDIIGDIHGRCDELVSLLTTLGYSKNKKDIYFNSERTVIFLGDFIDRGELQREVINIVKPMIDSGSALSVIGNHEFNAICYHTLNPNTGEYLRPHNEKNTNQHRAFLNSYSDHDDEKDQIIEWFKTLPLWLSLPEINIVHACWDQNSFDKIKSNIITDDLLLNSSTDGTWQKQCVETILKGKKVNLPAGFSFKDADGHDRTKIRTKWWDSNSNTFSSSFLGSEKIRDYLPNSPLPKISIVTYSPSNKPLFFGHYWMNRDTDIYPITKNIACVDFSVAHDNGSLVAYRYEGEKSLSINKFVFQNRINE